MLALESCSGCQLRSEDLLTLRVLSSDRICGWLLILNRFCVQKTRQWGGFLMIFRKRTHVHSKLYKAYKGSGYLNQYTSPVHHYTMPTASQHTFQPTKTITLKVILVNPPLYPPNPPKPPHKHP